MRLVPVDHDPFAATPQSAGAGAPAQPRLEPVDYDPFAVSPSADAAQSARGGFAQGVARWLGGPADLAGVIAHGADFVRSKITGQPIEQVAAEADANARVPRSSVERFGSEAIGSAMRSNFAARNPGQADPMDHKPVTRVGKYLHAIGEAAPMAPLGPISTAVGAVVGEAGAQAAEHYAGGPGVASEAARAAGNMFGPTALARVITPVVTPRHLVRHNQVLEREGVPITAGQATGNPRLRAIESTSRDIPFAGSGATEAAVATDRGFNRAVARRMGEDLGPAGMLDTPQVAHAADRIQGQFRDLSARNVLVADPQLVGELRQVRMRNDHLLDDAQRATVDRIVGHKMGLFQPGHNNGPAWMPGDVYQAARSDLGTAAHTATNAREGRVLREMRDALDRAMERSIARTNPNDLGAWGEARRQYQGLKIAEEGLSNGGGAKTAQGFISPHQVAVGAKARNPEAYARGRDEFSDLAHAGKALITDLPQSGTVPRMIAAHTLSSLGGAAIGALGGYASGDKEAAGAGIGATTLGLLGPALAGRTVMSRPGQRYLSNRILGEGSNRLHRDGRGIARAIQSRDDD